MPIWSEIAGEILAAKGDSDAIRRKYLARLCRKTGRNAILYASNFVQANDALHSLVADDDLQGFMEVCHGLSSDKSLDLILHSPGGSAEAVVFYLRSRFSDIRVTVPYLAMSAATHV